MIIVQYNKETYHIPSEWKDITLTQAIDARGIDLPDDINDSFDWFRHLDTVKDGFKALTDVDPELIAPAQLVHFFSKYLYGFIKDLQSTQPETYKPRLIDSFRHNKKTYIMPTNLDLGVNVMLQHGQTVKPFIEASNLMKQFSSMRKDGIKALPMMIASLVKQSEDEVFDEAVINERANEFKTLGMDVGWEVFFCLSQLIIKYGNSTLQSMNSPKLNRMERLIKRLDMRLGRLQSHKAELQAQLKTFMR